MQLLTIASTLDSKGYVTGSVAEVTAKETAYDLSGSKEMFTDESSGIFANIKMDEMNALKGKSVRVSLKTPGTIHIDKL